MKLIGHEHRAWQLAAAGLVLLLLGTGVYLVDRPAGTTMLLPSGWSWHQDGASWFGHVGDFLPSFVHAFSFSLFTALLLPRTLGHTAAACGAWALLETLFEVGQHARVAPKLVEALGDTLSGLPGSEALRRYFQHGSFDPADMAAGIAGALVAFVVVMATMHRRPGPSASSR